MNEQKIFQATLERDPRERAAYLDEACGDDREGRRRIEHLLRMHERAGNFIEKPAAEIVEAVQNRSLSEGPGTRIGPYKLLQEIGEGGFGVVYMAEQREPMRRKVALKIVKPGMDTRNVVARFEAERQALAMMDHPNIAKVLDAGMVGGRGNSKEQKTNVKQIPKPQGPKEEGGAAGFGYSDLELVCDLRVGNCDFSPGRPYFVMELVHGVPITQFCDELKLSTDERLRLFLDVCRAVQHAHQKGIIHRDLKPSNILITMDDDRPLAKVIDFGIAKALKDQLTEKTLFTAYGQMVGTPTYMSPEQAQMSAADVDTRSDVYSLGVLLYELLTGTTPFDRGTLKEAGFDEMRRMIREDEPLRPSARISTFDQARLSTVSDQRGIEPARLRGSLHGDLDWIAMKCLEKDRDRRYESASAVAADVSRYLKDDPVEARAPTVGYRIQKFMRRNTPALCIAAALLFLLLLGTAGTVWQAVSATSEAHRAREAERLAEARQQQAEASRREEARQRRLAEQSAARAAAHFRQARRAVDEYFTLVSESTLLDEPGLQPLRRELLEAALTHYEGFVEEESDSAALRAELATGYLRAAQIHYVLDEYDEFIAYLEKALPRVEALLENATPESGYLESLGPVFIGGRSFYWSTRPSSDYRQARRVLEQVVHVWERLAERFPDRAAFRNDLAGFLLYLGDLDDTFGDNQAAVSAFGRAGDLWRALSREAPDVLEYQGNLANALEYLAKVLPAADRHDDVLTTLRAARRIRIKLVDADPSNPEYRHELAVTSGRIARHQQTPLDEAEELFHEEHRLLSELVQEFPHTPAYRERLAFAVAGIGTAARRSGRLDEAAAYYADALSAAEDLASDFPQRFQYREVLAVLSENVGFHLWRMGRETKEGSGVFSRNGPTGASQKGRPTPFSAAGKEAYARAIQLRMDLLEHYPDQPSRLAKVASLMLVWPDPLWNDPQRSLELAQEAVGRQSGAINHWRVLAAAHYRADNWHEALDHFSRWLSKGEPPGRGRTAGLFFLAMTHARLGHAAEARRWFDKAAAWMDEHAPRAERLRHLRAEAADLLSREEELPPSRTSN